MSCYLGENSIQRSQTSCQESFLDARDTRRELKTASLRVFCISIKADMKVKMVIALDESQGNGVVKVIKVEGGRNSWANR